MAETLRAAIFLDRDGVINENRAQYVRTWEQLQLLAGALPALVRLAGSAFAVVIVTNQSAIGRGLLGSGMAQHINTQLVAQLVQAGARIDGVYVCPHRPDEDCACRKPRPGMLLQAARELQLDLAKSWMVGDAVTDAQAGLAAGTQALLVRTGRGAEPGPVPAGVARVADLAAAVDHILSSLS
ncbi:MAG: HAD-IIIA family hydrolase [Chloroflexi bacterium]|nr:MAG: HAD-IIIA family hydrolase [Chloroflexota bacterium]